MIPKDYSGLSRSELIISLQRAMEAQEAAEKARDQVSRELQDMRRLYERVLDQRCEARRACEEATSSTWVWEDEGSDSLESMAEEMIVHITAGNLRGLLANAAGPAPAPRAVKCLELAD